MLTSVFRSSRCLLGNKSFSSTRMLSSKAAMSDVRVPDILPTVEILTINEEKINLLVKEVLSLNMLETCYFSKLVQESLNLPDVKETLYARLLSSASGLQVGTSAAPQAAAKPADQAASAAAAAPAAPPAKLAFSIKLESFAAGDKIKIIKLVREMTGLGLKEAKEKVEAMGVLMKDVPKEDADKWLEKLVASGGKAVLE